MRSAASQESASKENEGSESAQATLRVAPLELS
jgi:hypothetical protein